MTKPATAKDVSELLDLNKVQTLRLETILGHGLMAITSTHDLSKVITNTQDAVLVPTGAQPNEGMPDVVELKPGTKVDVEMTLGLKATGSKTGTEPSGQSDESTRQQPDYIVTPKVRLSFPGLNKPTQDTPKDEAPAASTAATPLDHLRINLTTFARPRMEKLVEYANGGNLGFSDRLAIMLGLTEWQQEIEGHLPYLRKLATSHGITREEFNDMANSVLRDLKVEFAGDAEKHDKSGPLTFNTMDKDGYSPEEGLINEQFRHTGNGKVYTIKNFAFNGATDEWNFVMYAEDSDVPIVRPMEHLTGKRENGEPRYIVV